MTSDPHVVSGRYLHLIDKNKQTNQYLPKHSTPCHTTFMRVVHIHNKVELKQPHYRPGQVVRVPGGWSSQISRQSPHKGGDVVSPMQRPPLPPGNAPGTHFCYMLSRPKGHIATGKIMSMTNSNDTIGNRTRDLPACSNIKIQVFVWSQHRYKQGQLITQRSVVTTDTTSFNTKNLRIWPQGVFTFFLFFSEHRRLLRRTNFIFRRVLWIAELFRTKVAQIIEHIFLFNDPFFQKSCRL